MLPGYININDKTDRYVNVKKHLKENNVEEKMYILFHIQLTVNFFQKQHIQKPQSVSKKLKSLTPTHRKPRSRQ